MPVAPDRKQRPALLDAGALAHCCDKLGEAIGVVVSVGARHVADAHAYPRLLRCDDDPIPPRVGVVARAKRRDVVDLVARVEQARRAA